MFDLPLFILLLAACAVAVAVSVPRQIAALRAVADQSLPGGGLAAGIQTMVLAVFGTVLGSTFAIRVGLGAPYLSALAHGNATGTQLTRLLVPTMIASFVAAGGFLLLYYGWFRPRLPLRDVLLAERLRLQMGIWARMLQGGVVEEVIFRWGMMALVAWLGQSLTGGPSNVTMWLAIAVAAVAFGLGHLPGAFALGLQTSGLGLPAIMILNMWCGMFFGWIFWQYGLLAAMLSHALVHVVWLPFERRGVDRAPAEEPAG